IAVSWWVSAKRTRSYPYARVYDTLSFSGKKVAVIPIVKDEGSKGDRDFLQWDTISLMSLLGVYVIISYYKDAERSERYRHKITNQLFDIAYLKDEIENLLSYQSDALHWNLMQIDKVGEIGQKALKSYDRISNKLRVDMHSKGSAEKRIANLLKGRDEFMNLSRELAQSAQQRESVTIQPKEKLAGTKALLTITNYLGGCYYFTADEVGIKGRKVYLIEGKHSATNTIPSLEDIKDGLFKMILFTNLEDVEIDRVNYMPKPVLKLTVKGGFRISNLNKSQRNNVDLLNKEADTNGFGILLR
ncbi:MAG: hypothetical protein A2W23_04245, partial [Planctomycetes bacterium RBG_16_43_13]